jgi:hypothetical protein
MKGAGSKGCESDGGSTACGSKPLLASVQEALAAPALMEVVRRAIQEVESPIPLKQLQAQERAECAVQGNTS